LDFTYFESCKIRYLKRNKKDKTIKKIITKILDEVNLICENCKFDFEIDRKNTKYVRDANRRSIYILNIFYKSLFAKTGVLKIEISFIENLIFEIEEMKINNIVDLIKVDKLFLNAINYDLKNCNILSYSLDEIILEKFRACVTRDYFKERDILDLFLINEKKKVFEIDKKNLREKLMCSPFRDKSFEIIKKEFLERFENENFVSNEDVKDLSLKDFDFEKYLKFKDECLNWLKEFFKE
jgi:hypothetical protein